MSNGTEISQDEVLTTLTRLKGSNLLIVKVRLSDGEEDSLVIIQNESSSVTISYVRPLYQQCYNINYDEKWQCFNKSQTDPIFIVPIHGTPLMQTLKFTCSLNVLLDVEWKRNI